MILLRIYLVRSVTSKFPKDPKYIHTKISAKIKIQIPALNI